MECFVINSCLVTLVYNMADKQLIAPVLCKLTKLLKPPTSSSIRKAKRNRSRKFRRKRSRRIRCISCLKQVEFEETSQELCRTTEVLDITDMDCAPSSFEPAIKDVAEWQNVHQLAYWKSRAVSLEYENNMLHEHIRNMYGKQIREFAGVEEEEEDGVNEMALPPKEQPGKARQEEMKKLYGKMAPKICGMETAVQLNYDFHVDKYNPPYWPNLPLKL